MTTTTRKQTPAQARRAALESDYTPLYAAAGLTEAVATTVQATLIQTSEKASRRLTAWQDRSEKQAKSAAADVTNLVKSLPEQVKALPETTKAQLAEWQKQAQDLVREANAAYGELAGRGKRAVDETISSARQLSGVAEKRATDARADLVDAVDPAFEQVQETVTRARKNVTGRTATETVTPRSTQKATATRAAARGAAEQRTATKKATAKKAAAKRTAQKAAQA